MNTIDSYRVGRNWIRVGDRVRIAPLVKGKHGGFDSVIHRIHADEDGLPTGVDVTDPHTGAVRTIRPDRITRKRQPKATA